MREYFSQEIKSLEDELLALKSAMAKSAGVIMLHKEEMSLNIAFDNDGDIGPPSKVVSIKIISGENRPLYFVTLDKYYDDLSPGSTEFGRTRHRWFRLEEVNGNILIKLTVIGTEDDRITLNTGGSVVVPVKLTVYGTNLFSLEAI